jgi:inosose dehydratase
VKQARAARQKFEIGYHLNSWDLVGLPVQPALAFLADQGFRWVEMLAGVSLSSQFSRRVMKLGHMPPLGLVSDTDIFRRFAILSEAQRSLAVRVSSLYLGLEYINPVSWPYEIGVLETLMRILRGLGAPVLVLGGGKPETAAEPHTTEDYKAFCRALEEIGRRSNDLGISTVYHPHLFNFIQTRPQLDRVMDEIDTSLVGLCIDPAHLAHSGADPVDALRTYISVVRYMHLKDTRVDPNFTGPQKLKAFCELGAGVVDIKGIVDVLLDADYDGLAIIELDASQKTAEESAIESLAYLRGELGLTIRPAATP